jgi:hypothetical protein
MRRSRPSLRLTPGGSTTAFTMRSRLDRRSADHESRSTDVVAAARQWRRPPAWRRVPAPRWHSHPVRVPGSSLVGGERDRGVVRDAVDPRPLRAVATKLRQCRPQTRSRSLETGPLVQSDDVRTTTTNGAAAPHSGAATPRTRPGRPLPLVKGSLDGVRLSYRVRGRTKLRDTREFESEITRPLKRAP